MSDSMSTEPADKLPPPAGLIGRLLQISTQETVTFTSVEDEFTELFLLEQNFGPRNDLLRGEWLAMVQRAKDGSSIPDEEVNSLLERMIVSLDLASTVNPPRERGLDFGADRELTRAFVSNTIARSMPDQGLPYPHLS